MHVENALLAVERNQFLTFYTSVVGENAEFHEEMGSVSSSIQTLNDNKQELENIKANKMDNIRLIVNATMRPCGIRLTHDIKAHTNAVDLRFVVVARGSEVGFVVNPSVVERYESLHPIATVRL